MAIRSNVNRREQWFVKNVSNKLITVGDLPKLPAFNPGDEYDLLAYHSKDQISNSSDLTLLTQFGWIRITKKKDNTATTYTSRTDINDSIATAEEDEANGTGGSDGTVKVSSNDSTGGYLNGKLVAGANVSLTEGSDGGNETLTIAAGAGASIAVENDGSAVVTASTLNFGTGLTATDAGGGQADIVLDSHTHAASDVTSGTFADARIAQTNVTQHEAALTITESQISDLSHTTDTHIDVGNDGSTIVMDAARLDFDSKFTVTDATLGETDLTINEPNLTIWNLVVQGNQLLSGGATWDSGLTFNVSDLVYVIDGVIYTTSATQVTLDAADGSNDRIDVLVATSSSTVTKVTGTAQANPEKPDLNEDTQVEITFVTVPAGSLTPDIATVLIYDENAGTPTEWAATTSDPQFTLNSAADVFSGSVSIEATSAANADRVTFSAASTVDVTDVNLLEFNIKSKATWPSNKRLQLWFTLGGARVSNTVTIRDSNTRLGFDSSNTSSYQNLSINKAFFALSSDVVDGMVMRVAGGGAAIGFYVDRIRWQEGVPTATLQPNWLTIVGDTGSTVANSEADTLKIFGDGGSADAYIRTDIVDDTVSISLNRTLIENHIPMHLIGPITTTTDLYKSLMGYAFKYRFTGPGIITKIIARQGVVDSGASQATVDVVVDSISALSTPITLSGSADTDATGVLSGNITIANGDVIELDITQGTNGDAEDLAIDIVFTTSLQR